MVKYKYKMIYTEYKSFCFNYDQSRGDIDVMKKARIFIYVFLLLVVILGGWKLANLYSESKDVFPEGTRINGFDVRGMTASEVEKMLVNKWQNKSYTLTENGKTLAVIPKLNYPYDISEALSELVNQNPISCIYRAIAKPKRNLKVAMNIKGTPRSLKNSIESYDFLNVKATRKTKDAYVDLDDEDFRIVKEVYGNNIDKNRFLQTVKKDIAEGKFEREFRLKDFYELPKLKSGDKFLFDFQNWCHANLVQKIKFKCFDGSFTLTPKQIYKCYNVDKNLNKEIDNNGVKKVAWDLANEHNTRYKSRNFVPHGKKKPITIWGGDYGWVLDQKYMVKQIKYALQRGGDSTFEMEYKQKPYYTGDEKDDIGKSYIEVSIGRQTLWLVKKGKTVFSSPVVTGGKNHGTPQGAYFVTAKERNTTLKGNNDNGSAYESKVSYWIPFNGGIGCHDAHWRKKFGGDIYLSDGSHGCVNMSPGDAERLYDQVEVGFPVIVY